MKIIPSYVVLKKSHLLESEYGSRGPSKQIFNIVDYLKKKEMF